MVAEAMHEGRPVTRSVASRAASALLATVSTRAFQQAAVLVAAMLIAAGAVFWAMLARTSDVLSRQAIEALSMEADALSEIADAAGPSALIDAVSRRSQGSAGRIYFLESSAGARLAGNLDRWPAGLAKPAAGQRGGMTGGTFDYRTGTGGTNHLAAGVSRRLVSDMKLLVGRDLDPQRRHIDQLRWLYVAGFGALALAGLLAGVVASRVALGRIANVTATSDQIMTGDFSRRVAITGSGDELDRLATNLNAMLDRIESLMAGLREVSDNIAHDLKTPLTRLRARAEAAFRETREGPAREGLGQVIEDADELIKTFNALLLIARLEAGALEGSAETFDVAGLVRDVAELYEPVADEAGMTFSCRAERAVLVRANRQLVGQALANMIDNAIKYGQTGKQRAADAGETSTADITVELDAREDGSATITVADRGPGIPARDRERVVKRFVRLESSRTKPGTGLGLSLVAAVARLHGGQIRLEDNAPGLKVVLELPAGT